jgi:hypothetical protein
MTQRQITNYKSNNLLILVGGTRVLPETILKFQNAKSHSGVSSPLNRRICGHRIWHVRLSFHLLWLRRWCRAQPPALPSPSPQASIWLWDQWVEVAPTHVLGTAPTLDLFGCENGFDSSSVWLEDWDGVRFILFSVWLDGFKQNLHMVTFALKWWGYPPQFMQHIAIFVLNT